MRAAIVAAIAAVVLVAMPSAGSADARIRRAEESARQYLKGHDRYVDGGVVLYVVEKDPAGHELVSGKPRLRVVDKHERGGIIDTRTHQIVGPSENPVAWFNSREGAEVVLHGEHLPPKLLVEGGMGTGKTTDTGQWLWFRSLELLEFRGEIGATAPTNERTVMIQQAIFDLWPEEWWRWKERDRIFRTATGHVIRLASTHRSSKAEGSRIQGYSWLAHAGEELQDCWEENGNIEARGRDAPNGIFKRINSVTVKDDPGWRTYKESLLKPDEHGNPSPWALRRKSVFTAPFVDDKYIQDIRSAMTDQEFRRKMGAEDVASEKRVYYAFARTDSKGRPANLAPIPKRFAKDVTNRELARFGTGNYEYLLAHDAGRIFDVTEVLKAYLVNGIALPVWYVVGEITTERIGTQGHVRAVLKYLHENFQAAPSQCYGKGDRFVDGENDENKPSRDIFTIWKQHGVLMQPAMFRPGSTAPAQIGREARLDMMNTLFCSVDDERRLVIAADERTGAPAAPRLLDAVESLEVDAEWRAERGPKNKSDKTHWPVAVGLGLYAIEHPRISAIINAIRGGR